MEQNPRAPHHPKGCRVFAARLESCATVVSNAPKVAETNGISRGAREQAEMANNKLAAARWTADREVSVARRRRWLGPFLK